MTLQEKNYLRVTTLVHPPLGLISLAARCVRAGNVAYVYDLGLAVEPKKRFHQALRADLQGTLVKLHFDVSLAYAIESAWLLQPTLPTDSPRSAESQPRS
jgi:hypothetical protein